MIGSSILLSMYSVVSGIKQ
ncbi:Protein of unknown function [Escherichia coli D6-113.11]|nr:Protein of unknown function [Escherichia coli D6-113.11]CDU35262.1 Protein of unknown function [Escherichia coli D6-113.11]